MTKIYVRGLFGSQNMKDKPSMYIRRAPPWSKKERIIARMPRRRSKESNDSSAPKRRYYHTLEELERMRKTKERGE